MTQAKAATVANALITAGYRVSVYLKPTNEWAIRVTDNTNSSSASTIATFASNQSVNANVFDVEFI